MDSALDHTRLEHGLWACYSYAVTLGRHQLCLVPTLLRALHTFDFQFMRLWLRHSSRAVRTRGRPRVDKESSPHSRGLPSVCTHYKFMGLKVAVRGAPGRPRVDKESSPHSRGLPSVCTHYKFM